jgi:rubrerythrin
MSKSSNPTTLVRFLSSAVDMEEQFSNSVYHDYLDPADWPVDFEREVFEKIKEHLTFLIEDSIKHEGILRELTRQYSNGTRDKKTIIRELELMEGFELSAKEFYTRIGLHPQIKEEHVRETFKNLADAEQRHAEIVREIIDLVNDA